MDFSYISIAMPEIVLLTMACITLLVDAFLPEQKRIVTYLLVQLTLIITFIITLPQFREYPQALIIFNGNYVLDKLAVLAKLFIYVFSFFGFIYTRDYLQAKKIPSGEYYLLGLFSVLGMSIMASGNTFLSIYLGLELLSLCLYAMVALYKNSRLASEAAMKYFILGSLASGILLYGISLLYGLTGQIALTSVGLLLSDQHGLLPVVALIFVVSGLIFKFGAVPFHMWVPDVYEGASTPTTLFIASAPKVAAFAIVLRILVEAVPSLQIDWQHILIFISILSMFLGNVVAIVQSNFKRLLAFSSIAHIGYALLGIIAGPDSSQGYSAAMFYICTYAIVASGAFAIVTIMGEQGVEGDRLEDYRGLNARNPWLAFLMLLLLFSMAGVPPTVGFFAKLGLIEALVQAHYVWLAVLALVFALIGAYYYLRVVMIMYFEEPQEGDVLTPIKMSKEVLIAISINGLAAFILGVLPSSLIDLCRISVG